MTLSRRFNNQSPAESWNNMMLRWGVCGSLSSAGKLCLLISKLEEHCAKNWSFEEDSTPSSLDVTPWVQGQLSKLKHDNAGKTLDIFWRTPCALDGSIQSHEGSGHYLKFDLMLGSCECGIPALTKYPMCPHLVYAAEKKSF